MLAVRGPYLQTKSKPEKGAFAWATIRDKDHQVFI